VRIKIISMPAGQAPKWVRREWVGLELPVHEKPVDGDYHGVLGGEPEKENIGGFHVEAYVAVAILNAKSPDAANWWRKNCPYLFGYNQHLVFGRQYCEVVKTLPL